VETALWTILAGALSGVSCAIVGCFLVLRRMSLLGDAISHAVLPGLVLGYLVSGQITGLPIVLGALLMGLLTAFLTQSVMKATRVPEDASLGVVFTALFAVGVIGINLFARQVDLDPGCVLYGLIEFIPAERADWFGWDIPREVPQLAYTLIIVVAVVALFWKEFKIASFDPELSTTLGYSSVLLHYLLMALVAAVTVASFRSVGSILVVAMLVVPAAAAHLLTDRLLPMLLWASMVAALSAMLGYAGAFHWNTSVAGMMAVAAGGLFGLALVFTPRHGLAAKAWRQLRLAVRIVREDLLGQLYRAEEARERGERGEAGVGWAELVGGSRRFARRVAVRQLLRRGMVTAAEDEVRLTARGRERAVQLVRAHRLWESYLGEHAALPPDHLHAPAEKMEHYVGPGLLKELEKDLHQPVTDPHGRAIPDAGRPRKETST
jgi:ABC-type Mn2+/Zn2+ transport system permease subunit